MKICPRCAQPLPEETGVCSHCDTSAVPTLRGLSRSNYATIAVIVGSIGWVVMRSIPKAAADTIDATPSAINADALPAATLLAYGNWVAAACFVLAVGLAVVALFANPSPPRR